MAWVPPARQEGRPDTMLFCMYGCRHLRLRLLNSSYKVFRKKYLTLTMAGIVVAYSWWLSLSISCLFLCLIPTCLSNVFFFFKECVWMGCLHIVPAHHMCAWYSWELEEDVRSSAAEVVVSCKLSCQPWESNLCRNKCLNHCDIFLALPTDQVTFLKCTNHTDRLKNLDLGIDWTRISFGQTVQPFSSSTLLLCLEGRLRNQDQICTKLWVKPVSCKTLFCLRPTDWKETCCPLSVFVWL